MPYNWQLPDWPDFRYDLSEMGGLLLAWAEKTVETSNLVVGLPDPQKAETLIDFMVAEALTTSEIEGETLSREDVHAAIRAGLGLATPPKNVAETCANGVAQVIIDIQETFNAPLTDTIL